MAEPSPDGSSPRIAPVSVRHAVALIAGVTVLSLAFFVIIAVQNVNDPEFFYRDPSALLDAPWYTGAASSIGIAGWVVAATVFGVVAVLRVESGISIAMPCTAVAVTTWMWFDDLFEFHETVFPRLGGTELLLLMAYALLVPAWLFVNRASFGAPAGLLALGALAGFGGSVLLDQLFEGDDPLITKADVWFAESLAKFIGIWLWAAFALAILAQDRSAAHGSQEHRTDS